MSDSGHSPAFIKTGKLLEQEHVEPDTLTQLEELEKHIRLDERVITPFLTNAWRAKD